TETTDPASLPYAVARVSWAGGSASEFCGGKAALPSEAARVAVCEAAERFQVTFARPGETLVRAAYDELRDRAVDPRALFFDAVPGHGTTLRPYSDHAPALWTTVDDPLGGPRRLVPAEEVWFDATEAEGCFVAQTTSGCALGATREEAAAFGMLEAVERDAFLTAWYLRRPCAPIDPDSVASEAFQLLRRRWEAAYSDYNFHLFDATGDARVPVVIGVAVRRRGSGPRAFVSAAARLSAGRACHAALKDLAGFLPVLPEEKRRAYRASLEAPEQVRGPAGHFETYALDEAFARLEFLDFAPAPRGAVTAAEIDARALVAPAERHQPREVVRRVAARLRALGAALYLKDLTHPALASRGLHCVRAVTPGLYPMWFGPATRRFAVTERLRRLSREWTGREIHGEADCNLEVHPLA
ncbi:MAG TPA: YcaO-like family protein, partial [Longimicrobium sp.]|nr:YcaO-like family protein [Longimicrobium sp.]